MDDNLDSQSTEQKSNTNPKNENKRIDSIPLWLQGISEKATTSQEPDEGEWRKEQAFVANQETGPTSIDLTDAAPWEKLIGEPETSEIEDSAEQENPLPDWIEEAKEIVEDEITSTIPLKNSEEEVDEIEEITEEVILEQPAEAESIVPGEPELSENVSPEAVSSPTQNDWGFEEIHLEEVEAEIENANEDEILSETEEIPEWLREMIAADEKQKAADKSKLASRSDEPTQPVVVTPLAENQDKAPVEEVESLNQRGQGEEEALHSEKSKRSAFMPNASLSIFAEEPTKKEIPSSETEETGAQENDAFDDLHLERDFNAEFVGSGFEPIQFETPAREEQHEEDDSIEADEELPTHEPVEEKEEIVLEDWGTPKASVEPEADSPEQPVEVFETDHKADEPPQESIDDIPSPLIQAKQILEQGEVKEALEIIKSYISQSQYLNEIKDWLLIANDKFEKNKSGLWEALGDISSHQGDYPNALNAYAKAIEYLELSRKSQNEIG